MRIVNTVRWDMEYLSGFRLYLLLNSETQINYPWESCPPLSNDWGWTPNAPFKSPQKIINILIGIIAKGGCLLLGVGLTPSKTK